MGGYKTSLDLHPSFTPFTITTRRSAKRREQTLDFLSLHLPTIPTRPRLHLAWRQRTSAIPQARHIVNTATLQSSPPQQPPQSQTPNRPHPPFPPHNHPLNNKRPNQSLRSPRPRDPTLLNPANPRTHQRRADRRNLGGSFRASAQNQN
jgi:hypothetical protein